MYLLSCIGAPAQTPVPKPRAVVIDAESRETFLNILGVWELRDASVIVNDAGARQLLNLNNKLQRTRIVLDSASGAGNWYGPAPTPLIPYLADSSLFVDGAARALLVIDPLGNVARAMAGPPDDYLRFLAGAASGTDAQGRLIFRTQTVIQATSGPDASGMLVSVQKLPDSASIVRLNLETRKIDTIGSIRQQNGSSSKLTVARDGKRNTTFIVNPLETMDEWAVLANGSVAFVRGGDYHVEVRNADGKVVNGEKLPFDWKRLSDEDKKLLVDSMKSSFEHAKDAASAAGSSDGVVEALYSLVRRTSAGIAQFLPPPSSTSGTTGVRRSGMAVARIPNVEFVRGEDLSDYYPAIRGGAAMADRSGTLWILPATSRQSDGRLVYDNVDSTGKLIQRVALPTGRSIAGFGRRGAIFLISTAESGKWKLERAHLEN